MFTENLPPDFKAGFVAVAGCPDVGRSTLMNVLWARKVGVVSFQPQTKRKRQLGILSLPERSWTIPWRTR